MVMNRNATVQAWVLPLGADTALISSGSHPAPVKRARETFSLLLSVLLREETITNWGVEGRSVRLQLAMCFFIILLHKLLCQ
jgi:hypothetical protein